MLQDSKAIWVLVLVTDAVHLDPRSGRHWQVASLVLVPLYIFKPCPSPPLTAKLFRLRKQEAVGIQDVVVSTAPPRIGIVN